MKATIAGIPTDPSARFLRQFAAGALVMLGAAGALLWFRGHPLAAVALWAAGGLVGAVGLVCPRALRWVFLAMALATLPIGLTVSTVVLLVIYLLVFTPMACIMRLTGRDTMTRRFDRAAGSYWLARPEGSRRNYFRQF